MLLYAQLQIFTCSESMLLAPHRDHCCKPFRGQPILLSTSAEENPVFSADIVVATLQDEEEEDADAPRGMLTASHR